MWRGQRGGGKTPSVYGDDAMVREMGRCRMEMRDGMGATKPCNDPSPLWRGSYSSSASTDPTSSDDSHNRHLVLFFIELTTPVLQEQRTRAT